MSWVSYLPSLRKPLPMARRLSASHSLPPSTALGNQTFEVSCVCGETLTGTREIKPQTLTCPHCGSPVFVLPQDCYAETPPQRARSQTTPAKEKTARGVIEKLNRLAFWTRLREGRTKVGGQLGTAARHMRGWFKRRLNSLRLW